MKEESKRKEYYKQLNIKYLGIKRRCYNIKCKEYKYYGGKGIIICDEWRNKPIEFYKWSYENGYQPGYHIHRIDPNGNYSPDNCVYLSSFKHNKIHHPYILNREQIFNILVMYHLLNIGTFEIARRYNIHRNMVCMICRGKYQEKYYKFYYDNVDDILKEMGLEKKEHPLWLMIYRLRIWLTIYRIRSILNKTTLSFTKELCSMADLTPQAKRFISVWWQSTSVSEVMEKLKDDPEYKGLSEEALKKKITTRCNNYRGLKIPMKKYRQGVAVVDTKAAKLFIEKELGVSKADIAKALKKKGEE